MPRAKQLPPPPLPPPGGGEQRPGAILQSQSGKVAADADLVTTAVPTTAPATKPIDFSALRRARSNFIVLLNSISETNCTSQSLCGSGAFGQRPKSLATQHVGITPKEVANSLGGLDAFKRRLEPSPLARSKMAIHARKISGTIQLRLLWRASRVLRRRRTRFGRLSFYTSGVAGMRGSSSRDLIVRRISSFCVAGPRRLLARRLRTEEAGLATPCRLCPIVRNSH